MPKEKVREQYITPWILAFPKAKLLMRRPFRAAKQYGMGLYNDMAGHGKGAPKSGCNGSGRAAIMRSQKKRMHCGRCRISGKRRHPGVS